MSRPDASLHSVGGRRRWAGVGMVPTSSPLRALLLYRRLWSPVNCCSMCSLAPAPKTTQALRQMRNAAPDLSPQQRVPLGARHGLWSLVLGSLPGASKQVEPRTQSHMKEEGFQGGVWRGLERGPHRPRTLTTLLALPGMSGFPGTQCLSAELGEKMVSCKSEH